MKISVSLIKTLVLNKNGTLGHVSLGWCSLWSSSALHHLSQQPQHIQFSRQTSRLAPPQREPMSFTVHYQGTGLTRARGTAGFLQVPTLRPHLRGMPPHIQNKEAGSNLKKTTPLTTVKIKAAIFPRSTPAAFGQTDGPTDNGQQT